MLMIPSWWHIRSRLGFLLALNVAVSARAAFYEITVEGTVTRSAYINVAVGDPFTIRYTADATDLNPSPSGGRYAVVQRAVATLPNAMLISPPYGDIYLSLDNNAHRDDFFAYNGWTPNGPFQIFFEFPAGTIRSDALPVSLPLDQATFAQWNFGGDLGENLIGAITFYEGVEVPEPGFGFVLLPLILLARDAGSVSSRCPVPVSPRSPLPLVVCNEVTVTGLSKLAPNVVDRRYSSVMS
jgi:hypothetical protein